MRFQGILRKYVLLYIEAPACFLIRFYIFHLQLRNSFNFIFFILNIKDHLNNSNILQLFAERSIQKRENNSLNENSSGRLHDNDKYKLRYGQNWMYEAAINLQKLAQNINQDPIALAVAWVSYNDAITSPIISARNLKQLQSSLDSTNISLNEETYKLISTISPTPPPATDRLEEMSH